MRAVIVGFNDYDKLNNTMEKLITDSQCYLFTVLCGGTQDVVRLPFMEDQHIVDPAIPIGERWARNNGVPVEYCYNANAEQLLDKIANTADYIVADLSSDNQFIKRLIMKMKSMGKHGTVV